MHSSCPGFVQWAYFILLHCLHIVFEAGGSGDAHLHLGAWSSSTPIPLPSVRSRSIDRATRNKREGAGPSAAWRRARPWRAGPARDGEGGDPPGAPAARRRVSPRVGPRQPALRGRRPRQRPSRLPVRGPFAAPGQPASLRGPVSRLRACLEVLSVKPRVKRPLRPHEQRADGDR